MPKPETDLENRERRLKELEGKNINHYSVILSAYLNSGSEINKAILAISSAAIGLLIAAYQDLSNITCFSKLIFTIALVAFCLAIILTLFVFYSNQKYFEAVIREKSEDKSLKELKLYRYCNYTFFGLGIGSAALLAITKVWI
ncbi:Uncharacterised protein [Vibrio mimicus]|uniref:hypothetical protein n=1 Tax=Vibrio TaxID=662 RepID=UPI0002B9FB26|nr:MULTISPECIES: hypothetical protein [Vibrio]EKF9288539.1 hypothetical protein [Vibrio cholerae]EKF9835985.1 hypothetical protein [Vibrio cholerae]EKF9847012.1 hypothetical protein [Vibrio cholerae]ELA6198908.1 hypothetical protein [Vibrio cholerae]EMA3775671.1 hypothetical protein [Vibrio cholerae]